MATNYAVRAQKDSLALFFVLAFAITWGIAALLMLLPEQVETLFGTLSPLHPLFLLAVWSPMIAAVVLTLAKEGRAGLRALFAGFLRWRVGWKWYVLILAGIPAVAWIVSRFAGSEPAYDPGDPGSLLPLLVALVITGPLGEEAGWRGFALPRLLRRFQPLVASLVLGILWGIWHLPSFFVSGLPQDGTSIPAFLIMSLCLSILATWIYIRTGGSLLLIVLFHLMVNFGLSVIGAPTAGSAIATFAAVVLVVVLDQNFGWFRRASTVRKDEVEQAFG